MSDLPRVFISHSSKDNELTEKVCALLRPTAEAPSSGYHVLVDYTDLAPGVEWPKYLHAWMAECHAAVLLLTRNAVTSPWVLKEATILLWRRSQDPTFNVYPIVFPDVTKAELAENKFSPLYLDRIQRVGSTEAQDIAAAVCGGVGRPAVAPTLFDHWVGALSDLLAGLGPNTLQRIAESVGVDKPVWEPGRDLKVQHIERIAREILNDNLGQYSGIDELIDALSKTATKEWARKIFRLVASHWVDPEAASRLPALSSRQPHSAAALNGAKVAEFTAEMYVRRAFPLTSRPEVIAPPLASAGAYVSEVQAAVCDEIRVRENRPDDVDDAIVAELKLRKPFLFVVLPPEPPARQRELDELRTLFPTVTFLLWIGEEFRDDAVLPDVERLTPTLLLDREARARFSFQEAERIILKMD